LNSLKKYISIVSDEASLNFEEAYNICQPLGINTFELRNFIEGRFPDISKSTINNILQIKNSHNIKIFSVNPGLFKFDVKDTEQITKQIQKIYESFKIMEILHIKTISLFSFKRTGNIKDKIPNKVFNVLGNIKYLCEKEGFELIIENSPLCWADSGCNLSIISSQIPLKVTWDPANAAASGEKAFPNGFNKIKNRIRNIHLKNWDPQKGYVNIQDGNIDFNKHIKALINIGYKGHYCIEHHQSKTREESTKINYKQLCDILKYYNQ
jgi:sugar phosphate isomerase/epimerase